MLLYVIARVCVSLSIFTRERRESARRIEIDRVRGRKEWREEDVRKRGREEELEGASEQESERGMK